MEQKLPIWSAFSEAVLAADMIITFENFLAKFKQVFDKDSGVNFAAQKCLTLSKCTEVRLIMRFHSVTIPALADSWVEQNFLDWGVASQLQLKLEALSIALKVTALKGTHLVHVTHRSGPVHLPWQSQWVPEFFHLWCSWYTAGVRLPLVKNSQPLYWLGPPDGFWLESSLSWGMSVLCFSSWIYFFTGRSFRWPN